MLSEDEYNFSKQRRNLMWISSILIFHEFLNIEYRDIDIFKAGIKVGLSENIPFVLWGLWIYFFYRYMNIFFEGTEKGWGSIKSKYESCLIKISKNMGEKATGENFDNLSLERDDKLFLEQKITWSLHTYQPGTFKITPFFEHKYNLFHSAIIYLAIFIKSIFTNHYFSEYYLPIIWATIPIIVWFPRLIN